MSLIQDIYALFPGAKQQTGYVRVKCPYHNNGQERHPSMSIITEPHNGMKPGFAKCFSCGWQGTFAQIAADFGLQYVPEEKSIELSENFKSQELPLHLEQSVYKKDVPYAYSPYLASRGIFEDVQKLFKVYEKKDEQKVYMPVFSRDEKF